MFKDNTTDNVFLWPTGSGTSTINVTLNFGAETKEQLVERLIKEGKISLREGMTLMDNPIGTYPVTPYVPYYPIAPYIPDPWPQPWVQPYSPTYPTYTVGDHFAGDPNKYFCGDLPSNCGFGNTGGTFGFSNVTGQA